MAEMGRINRKKLERILMLLYGSWMILVLGGGSGYPVYYVSGNSDMETSGMVVSCETDENQSPSLIALTFDDGPNPVSTVRLLDGLKERGVKATFFLIGSCAKENPEVVKRIQEEGHLIGNHTYHHVKLSDLSESEAREEILKTDQLIRDITGEGTGFVRPPFGEWREDLEFDLEVMPVMWTIDPLDWTTENTDEIVERVVTKAEENAIILLHDCYESSVDAALRIVDILQAQNYEFVTAEQLLLD